jgi:GcrA cell cycle regulator
VGYNPNDHVWTAEDDKLLTEGWLGGRSCVTLAKELGVTKNSLVGRKGRLGLPNRLSPIRGGSANFKGRSGKRKVRVGSVTLPPIVAPIFVAPLPEPVMEQVVEVRCAPSPKLVTRRTTACCWPIGEPGTKTFRFCDDTARAGKPYCREHHAIAYISRAA